MSDDLVVGLRLDAESAGPYFKGVLTRAADEIDRLVNVIRLCHPYMPSAAHSEEADCDCDYLMDEVLRRYGVERSHG